MPDNTNMTETNPTPVPEDPGHLSDFTAPGPSLRPNNEVPPQPGIVPPANYNYPPPPPYGSPHYYQQGQQPVEPLAIVSLVASLTFLLGFWFISSILGVVFGHIALHNIKKNNRRGRGMALAGTIIGYVTLGLSVLIIGFVIIASLVVGSGSTDSKAYVQEHVRAEVQNLNSLVNQEDTDAVAAEQGIHKYTDGSYVYVSIDANADSFLVTGEDPEYPEYTYTYNSMTQQYTANGDTGSADDPGFSDNNGGLDT